jgi:SAM-dependent methyltransferase
MEQKYTDINSRTVDSWVEDGWIWGRPISHEDFVKAKNGDWSMVLTPTKPVPKEWFCDFPGAKILGLASGGGQQMPIFAALGAECTVLDYSEKQLQSERDVSEREGYGITVVKADMTEPLPFPDDSFDLIFHPVSNCYIEDVMPVWRECFRILKHGGILLAGLDNGINYALNDEETQLHYKLPFNALKDSKQYEDCVKNNWGVQFSHTIEEQVGGQLKAGFILTDIYGDTNSEGPLHDFNVPAFFATRSVKP